MLDIDHSFFKWTKQNPHVESSSFFWPQHITSFLHISNYKLHACHSKLNNIFQIHLITTLLPFGWGLTSIVLIWVTDSLRLKYSGRGEIGLVIFKPIHSVLSSSCDINFFISFTLPYCKNAADKFGLWLRDQHILCEHVHT